MEEKGLDDKHQPQPARPGSLSGHTDNEGEVGDLRSSHVAIKPQQRLLHDPAVTFEEYMYYAARTRAEEDKAALSDVKARVTLKTIFVPSAKNEGAAASGAWDAEVAELNLSDPKVRSGVTDEEWTNASRALRTASAAACFYLITTDILGPFVSDY